MAHKLTVEAIETLTAHVNKHHAELKVEDFLSAAEQFKGMSFLTDEVKENALAIIEKTIELLEDLATERQRNLSSWMER